MTAGMFHWRLSEITESLVSVARFLLIMSMNYAPEMSPSFIISKIML